MSATYVISYDGLPYAADVNNPALGSNSITPEAKLIKTVTAQVAVPDQVLSQASLVAKSSDIPEWGDCAALEYVTTALRSIPSAEMSASLSNQLETHSLAFRLSQFGIRNDFSDNRSLSLRLAAVASLEIDALGEAATALFEKAQRVFLVHPDHAQAAQDGQACGLIPDAQIIEYAQTGEVLRTYTGEEFSRIVHESTPNSIGLIVPAFDISRLCQKEVGTEHSIVKVDIPSSSTYNQPEPRFLLSEFKEGLLSVWSDLTEKIKSVWNASPCSGLFRGNYTDRALENFVDKSIRKLNIDTSIDTQEVICQRFHDLDPAAQHKKQRYYRTETINDEQRTLVVTENWVEAGRSNGKILFVRHKANTQDDGAKAMLVDEAEYQTNPCAAGMLPIPKKSEKLDSPEFATGLLIARTAEHYNLLDMLSQLRDNSGQLAWGKLTDLTEFERLEVAEAINRSFAAYATSKDPNVSVYAQTPQETVVPHTLQMRFIALTGKYICDALTDLKNFISSTRA